MGEIADRLKDKLGSGVVVLGADIGGAVRLVSKVSPDLVKKGLHAGKLVGKVANLVDGNGGGRPDFATAGGKSPEKLEDALTKVKDLVAEAAG
jgi:alanyl-tRNA synthetase